MKLKWISLLSIVTLLTLSIPSTARADVRDNAQIFSQDAVDAANRDMKSMEQKHNKQLVVETFAVVPDDQKAAAKADPKTFFRTWMNSPRAKDLKVNGVYVLICMDPHHVEVGAGKTTVSKGEFAATDVDNLRKQLQADLHDKEYDKALSGAVDTVERAFTENIRAANGRSTAARDREYTNQPAYAAPVHSQTPYNPPFNPNYSTGSGHGSSALGLTFGSLLCMIIGGVIIVSLIRSIFRGGSGGGFGGGGGYYPGNQGYGGNYGGGYGGGGGGGFGRGFLGGLLGGAVSSYAENRFENRGNQGNSGFSGGGGGGTNYDNSSTSSYDSGPSDAGQGFGDTSSGGDFGSSSSDSGGGSSDSGGGSSGGDF